MKGRHVSYTRQEGLVEQMNYLKTYMAKNFPGLTLELGLFYRWPISLRFGLRPLPGECQVREAPRSEWADKADHVLMDDPSFRSRLYNRAHAIFGEVHRPDDHLFLVVSGSRASNAAGRKHQGLRGLRRFFKRRQLPLSFNWVEHPLLEPGRSHDEFFPDYEICVQCLVTELRHGDLLAAIANRDFPDLRPVTLDDYFLVNTSRHLVFHMYDDRGIDIAFRNPDEFRATYRRLGDWLLAYDLPRMNEAFE